MHRRGVGRVLRREDGSAITGGTLTIEDLATAGACFCLSLPPCERGRADVPSSSSTTEQWMRHRFVNSLGRAKVGVVSETGEPSDDDRAAHARLIAGLRGPDVTKVQYRLQKLELRWRAVQPALPKWRPRRGIVPTADEVASVARFADHAASEVRRCVLKLVGHARSHLELVAPVVEAGLRDPEALVRLQAAEAAHELGAGVRLERALLAALDSPTWKLRWYAAAALAATPHRERAAEVFAAAFPARGNSQFGGIRLFDGTWAQLACAFTPPTPAIAARLDEVAARRAAGP